MKTRILILSLFSAMVLAGHAQNWTSQQCEQIVPMRSMQIAQPVTQYEGSLYRPFDNAAPSTYNENVSESFTGPRKLGNFDPVPEGGEQENSYPIGEPWILLLMAVVFGAVVYLRRRKTT